MNETDEILCITCKETLAKDKDKNDVEVLEILMIYDDNNKIVCPFCGTQQSPFEVYEPNTFMD